MIALLCACAHRRDLLPQDPKLDIFMRPGQVEVEYCNDNRVAFSGWPNLSPSPDGREALVTGLSLGEKRYVIWNCSATAFDHVGTVYGFLQGDPVITGILDEHALLVWGEYQAGPYKELMVSWEYSQIIGQPFFIARAPSGKLIVGVGRLEHGPFDGLGNPMFDPEDQSLTIPALIGQQIITLTIRPPEARKSHIITSEFLPPDF